MRRCAIFAIFLLVFLYSCRHHQPTIVFNYQYDLSKEVLDTTNTGTNPWYLPVQNDFVKWHNQNSSRTYLINPNSLGGLYWQPDYFVNKPLDAFDIPATTGYYVNVASEGVGFEGYAIVSMIHIDPHGIQVDASYGTFCNNSDRSYGACFWNSEQTPQGFKDSVILADSAYLPKTSAGEPPNYNIQYYSGDSLTRLRNQNTLFFGQVPPDLVRRSLNHTGNNLFIELTPEEYMFRLLRLRNLFRDELKVVDKHYLYGDFQEDWRALLREATYTSSTVLTDPDQQVIINSENYPVAAGGNTVEQLLFPHLEIQNRILDERINKAAPLNKSAIEGMVKLYKDEDRQKPFEISAADAQQVLHLEGDSIKIIFDTAALKNGGAIKSHPILGGRLRPLYYIGHGKNGKANKVGTLYAYGTDTIGQNYVSFSAQFKDGKGQGWFSCVYHKGEDGNIASYGHLNEGKITDQMIRYNTQGDRVSNGWYAEGDWMGDKKTLFHHYDNVYLSSTVKKLAALSDAYLTYQDHQVIGIDIPTDTTFSNSKVTTFLRDNAIYCFMSDQNMIFPYHRDYVHHQIVIDGPVVVHFNDGSILLGNYKEPFSITGPAYLYWPEYNDWFATTENNGVFTAVGPAPPQSDGGGGLLKHILHAATNPVGTLIDITKTAYNTVLGHESLKEAYEHLKSRAELDLAEHMSLEGGTVHWLGKAGEKIVDVTYPVAKAMLDYNASFSPLTSEIQLLSLANNKLGINNKVIENINNITSMVPGFRDKLIEGSGKLLFKTAEITGEAQQYLGTYLALASGGFPKEIHNPYVPERISKPELTAGVSDKLLTTIFENVFNHNIEVNKGIVTTVAIRGPKVISFNSVQNAINVSFSDGTIDIKEGIIKNTFTVKGCNIQLLPFIDQRNGHYFMDLRAIVTYLNLKDANEEIDKMLAWAVQNEFLNDRILDSIDITQLLSFSIEAKPKGQKEMSTNSFRRQYIKDSLRLRSVAWTINNNMLNISASVELVNQKASAAFSQVANSHSLISGILDGIICGDFPAVVPVPVTDNISAPDLSLKLSGRFMEMLLTNLFSSSFEIPLSGDSTKSMSDHYIVINRIKNLSFGADNVINLSLQGDIWFRTKLIKSKLTVSDVSVVIVPQLRKIGSSFFVFLDAQIKHIDIKDVPERFDKCLANYIADKGFFAHDSLAITPFLALTIKNPLDTAFNIAPVVDSVSVVSDTKNYFFNLHVH